LLRTDEDRVVSVPRQWTDVVAPDHEIVIGEGRTPLRLADLLELADLVARLTGQERRPCARKAKDAANVRQTSPRVRRKCRE
jgi:hypothetical protein